MDRLKVLQLQLDCVRNKANIKRLEFRQLELKTTVLEEDIRRYKATNHPESCREPETVANGAD